MKDMILLDKTRGLKTIIFIKWLNNSLITLEKCVIITERLIFYIQWEMISSMQMPIWFIKIWIFSLTTLTQTKKYTILISSTQPQKITSMKYTKRKYSFQLMITTSFLMPMARKLTGQVTSQVEFNLKRL